MRCIMPLSVRLYDTRETQIIAFARLVSRKCHGILNFSIMYTPYSDYDWSMPVYMRHTLYEP